MIIPMTKSLQDANKQIIILFLTIIISIISSKVIELRYSDSWFNQSYVLIWSIEYISQIWYEAHLDNEQDI